MRKFCFVLFILFSVSSIAENHLAFKGIPITGSLVEFAKKLEAQGYKISDSSTDMITLEGDFAGYEDCTIHLLQWWNSSRFNKVAVMFPVLLRWEDTLLMYTKLKKMLSQKYGYPTTVWEDFNYLTDSFLHNHSSISEPFPSKYYTLYETRYGSIKLLIERSQYGGIPPINCPIYIVYTDEQDSIKAMEDL